MLKAALSDDCAIEDLVSLSQKKTNLFVVLDMPCRGFPKHGVHPRYCLAHSNIEKSSRVGIKFDYTRCCCNLHNIETPSYLNGMW